MSTIGIKPIQMVDLKGQYTKIEEEIQAGWAEVVASCAFINGPAVKEFTANLSEYLSVKHTLPCANGTDALQLALMSLDLQPGDEVITVPFTFVATAEVIALLGLKPVFVDVDPQTFNMNVCEIEAAITKKTKCILPVHLYGQSSNMEPIMLLSEKYGIPVVEDNAQAIGANYTFMDKTIKKTGTVGTIGCTSFYPSKNLGAYGDAGAVFTNDDELADKIRWIANHGQRIKYQSDFIGVNSRLDSLQAVVLNAKLKRLDGYIAARNEAANFYDQAFVNHPKLEIPFRAGYSNHVFHQYTLKTTVNRDNLQKQLKEHGIPSMVYYPVPMHAHPAYANRFGYKIGDYPICEKLSESVISLPMHTELSEDQLVFIVEKVLECVD